MNDDMFVQNYKEIDLIFGSGGGGCEVCAVNLKRLWCHYACSDRQNEFMQVKDGY